MHANITSKEDTYIYEYINIASKEESYIYEYTNITSKEDTHVYKARVNKNIKSFPPSLSVCIYLWKRGWRENNMNKLYSEIHASKIPRPDNSPTA